MARTSSHKIVSIKMEILVEHRDYLQTFVDETNQVLQLTTSWLSKEDTTKSFTSSDINKMIDDKIAFLVSADFSAGCEEASTEQESVAARSFSTASKSTDQPLPAGHVHVSGVTAATDELKTIFSQVNVMQDAMSFLSTNSKMLSEKQDANERLVESLSDKYSKVEQEKLREIEGELAGIKEKHKKAAIQQDKRMTSFEKKIQAVTDTQSDIIENCHQQQIKIKDQKKETEKLKTQSQQFKKKLRDVLENVQELNAEISVLEKKTGTNTQMGALEGEIESLKESLEELSTRFEEHGSELEDITQRNEETLKGLPTAQESESEKLQKLEKKISALENSWSETTVENGKLCQDVETKYEMVCQIVTDRLGALERLRDIFNEKLDAKTEHRTLKKLDNVCDQMLPKCLQVEQATQQQAVGFLARLNFQPIESLRNKGALIFDHVTFNHGEHYDSRTGEFTAPLDGVYAVYFSVATCSLNNYNSEFTIVKQPCLCGDTCGECECGTALLRPGMFQASTFEFVEMNAYEKIFVKLTHCSGTNETYINISTFFCFKIF